MSKSFLIRLELDGMRDDLGAFIQALPEHSSGPGIRVPAWVASRKRLVRTPMPVGQSLELPEWILLFGCQLASILPAYV
jgi:hypothetical protein